MASTVDWLKGIVLDSISVDNYGRVEFEDLEYYAERFETESEDDTDVLLDIVIAWLVNDGTFTIVDGCKCLTERLEELRELEAEDEADRASYIEAVNAAWNAR